MIDILFWWINTIILGTLAYYSYKKYMYVSIQHDIQQSQVHKKTIERQAITLQEAYMHMHEEVAQQEITYHALVAKLDIWKNMVNTQTEHIRMQQEEMRDTIAQKDALQYENYQVKKQESALLTAVIARAQQDIQEIMHDPKAVKKYNERIFNFMQKG